MEQNFWQRNKTTLIIVVVVLIIMLWSVSKYNFFVNQNGAIDGQWAQVENQLQRRFSLIPNVISTVKGDAKQEKDIIAEITQARTHYAGATTTDQKATTAEQVESSLARLLVITENYPDRKSNQSFRDLMVELEGTENRIALERMKFNDLVKSLNINVKTFPNSILASIFGVKERAYFQVTEEAKVIPKVDFSQ
jgi:LemA protein